MTAISIVGVAIGVAALIIVLSVMGGFEQDLKRKMLKGQPHLEVLAENAVAGFSLKEHPLEKFKKAFPNATGVEAFTQADIVLKQGKHLSAVVMFGVNPTEEGHLWGFNDAMIEGNLKDIGGLHMPLVGPDDPNTKWPGIVLGEGLAGQLSADIGDEIVALSPQAASSSAVLAGGTLTRQYVVVGIFQTGLFNYDSKWAVVALDEGRKFIPDYDPSLDEDQYVTGVAVNVENPYDIEEPAAIVRTYKGLKPYTWKDSNSALLFALKLEKFTMGSILMLIVLVAAFSISGTMMMTVFHKKTQVCLLRSVGMTQRDVAKLFLAQGFVIGTVGIGLGLAFGLGVCVLIYNFQFVDIPTNVYFLKSLPVKFLPKEYGVICLFAWLLSLVGALYPALTASRQDPSSGLRY